MQATQLSQIFLDEVRFNGRTYGYYDQSTHTIHPYMGIEEGHTLKVEPDTHLVRDSKGNTVGRMDILGNIRPLLITV